MDKQLAISTHYDKNEKNYELIIKQLKDLQYALDQSAIVAITNQRGIILYVNEKLCEISQYKREELIGQDHRILNSNYHSKHFFKEMWKSIGTGNTWRGEIRNKAKDGSFYWVDTTIVPFLNDKGKPYQYISIRNDITERKNKEQQIKHLAYHDGLTNLPNRRYFMKRLNEEVANSMESKGRLAVMFIDLDNFKWVNDNWGHETGDVILTKVAKRIDEAIGANDMIGRLGGDEFAVLATNITGKNAVEQIAKRIIEKMEKPLESGDKHFTLSCSIGISMFPEDSQKGDDLLSKADTALYDIKDKSSIPYIFYTKEMETESFERMMLENELRKAIEQKQFKLYYQPKVDIKKKSITGMEALVRWDHPDLGVVSPGQFIPLAEKTGLIIPLGTFVLEEACFQMKRWKEQGFSPVKVAVNVSPKQMTQPNFLTSIQNILQKTNVDPKCLELEITESVFMEHEHATNLLQSIRDIGVRISVDDFGTGYSSLSYIKHLPIDTLKIDTSFIRDVHQNEESKAIVKAMITIAKSLGIQIVAEGIENQDQLEVLNNTGCNQGQGFLLGKPLSSDEVEKIYLQK